MFVPQHHANDHQLLKWAILVTLAGALVLFSTRATAGDPAHNDSPLDAKSHPVERSKTTEPKNGIAPTARRIWHILELHDSGLFEDAIQHWNATSFLDAGKQWRAVGLGAAYLKIGSLDDASGVLRDACDHEIDNAVTHHLLGVVYYTKARIADRNGQAYFADELRDLAFLEFEQAAVTASQVELDEPFGLQLTKFIARRRYDTIYPEMTMAPRKPRVSDLLGCLELADFSFKSHIGLAQINIDKGMLDEAENQLDTAATLGSSIGELYASLAKAYEKEGQNAAAARVLIKVTKNVEQRGGSTTQDIQRASPLELPAPGEESNR